MTILLRQARILSPGSPHHQLVRDILVEDGMIREIAENIEAPGARVIAHDHLHVSPGWMDLFAHFCDPGLEHKETLETGAAAAAAGGFTHVCVIPNTVPAISQKAQVEYIYHRSASLTVQVMPLGSVSRNAEGKDLAEMYDMYDSGAVAFIGGTLPILSGALMAKALQYVKKINKPIIQIPDERSLSAHGLMHEGIVSTRLGLPGKPAIAEEIMIARDIELLRYTGSALHLTGISTRKGLQLIRDAKSEGLNLTCSVTPYHLSFTDEDLTGYDTNLKVYPPLRSADDRAALLEGLLDGTVDAIASHHMPQHSDDKVCEFEYAKHGMTTLESLFGVANRVVGNPGKLVELLAIASREILNLPVPVIREGEPACLTLFDPREQYTFTRDMIQSRSSNSPFIGQQLTGKVLGIIHEQKVHLHP
ncbi:MAG TPA: dihydroorotase [Chitinophagaceae bacterium]|nr:dihydroorotase [Chitinophagaceae bacterium]